LDILLLVKAAVMGVVEGLTEFLPISSTGHLILTASLLGLSGETVKVFEIAIQTGAMLAVVWEYRARLAATLRGIGSEALAQRFARNLGIAFLPAVVLGLAFGSLIKAHLFHPVPVAAAFVLGGLIILWVERRHHASFGERDLEGRRHARVETVDDMSMLDALKVGLVQCAALIPGTSRSGATIIGAMLFGFSRKAATEFSFFLGIPTLMGAGAYSLLKQREALQWADAPMFAVGLVLAFLSALVCIRWLIRYVSTHDFTAFAWYRIAFGGLVLLSAWGGWVEWTA
jgi:undecaprenyl-diphosphatase